MKKYIGLALALMLPLFSVLATGALWVQNVGLLPGTAVVFGSDAPGIDRFMAAAMRSAYGNRVGILTGSPSIDTATIQAALDALPSTGGSLVLRTANVTTNATITRSIQNVVIQGIGTGTFFSLDNVTPIFRVGGNYWRFDNIGVDSGGIDEGIYPGRVLYTNYRVNDTLYAMRISGSGTGQINIGGNTTISTNTVNAGVTIAGANPTQYPQVSVYNKAHSANSSITGNIQFEGLKSDGSAYQPFQIMVVQDSDNATNASSHVNFNLWNAGQSATVFSLIDNYQMRFQDIGGITSHNNDGSRLNIRAANTGNSTQVVAQAISASLVTNSVFSVNGLAVPTTSTLNPGFWTIQYASGGNATFYVNDGGTIKKLNLGAPSP